MHHTQKKQVPWWEKWLGYTFVFGFCAFMINAELKGIDVTTAFISFLFIGFMIMAAIGVVLFIAAMLR